MLSHHDPKQVWFAQHDNTHRLDEPNDLHYDMDKIQAYYKKHRTPGTKIDSGWSDRFKTAFERQDAGEERFLSGKGMPSTGPAIGECCLRGSSVYGKKQVATFSHMRGRDGSLVTNIKQYLHKQSADNRKFLKDAKRRTDKARYELMSQGSIFSRAAAREKAAAEKSKPREKGVKKPPEVVDPLEQRRLAAKAADSRLSPPPCPAFEAPKNFLEAVPPQNEKPVAIKCT